MELQIYIKFRLPEHDIFPLFSKNPFEPGIILRHNHS